jgi:hypothetical protein
LLTQPGVLEAGQHAADATVLCQDPLENADQRVLPFALALASETAEYLPQKATHARLPRMPVECLTRGCLIAIRTLDFSRSHFLLQEPTPVGSALFFWHPAHSMQQA